MKCGFLLDANQYKSVYWQRETLLLILALLLLLLVVVTGIREYGHPFTIGITAVILGVFEPI